MWKYNYTDEMFTRKNDELFHSDVYLGKDFSDGIKHWKYLRKEVRNGRTYYIYDDSEKQKAKREYNNAKKVYKNTTYRDSKGYGHAPGERGMNKVLAESVLTNTAKGQTYEDRKNERSSRKALDTIKKYRARSIQDIPKRTLSRGISLISNFLKNVRGD